MRILLLLIICWTSTTLVAQTFSEVSSDAGLIFSREYLYNIGGGVSIIDYDNDGWEDVFLPGGYGSTVLFKNNGDGTFLDVTQNVFNLNLLAKLDSLLVTSSVVGDIDNDGDKDIFVVTSGYKIHNGVLKRPHVLLENLGDGTFSDISNSAGIVHSMYGEAATMGDYNLDGYLDIYVSNYVHSMDGIFDNFGNQIGYVPECIPNNFYINNGDKTFTEAAMEFGIGDQGCALTSSFTDYDFDHDVDILLANDFGEWNVYPNALFTNNHPLNSFSSDGATSGFNRSMYGMGIAPGDFNEDGHMDYYVTNIGTNSLYQNNGDGTFSDVALAKGVDNTWAIEDSLQNTSWGCVFFDLDNDTYLDLFVATGSVLAFIPMTPILDSNRLYRNDGAGNFEEISVSAGLSDVIANRGVASFDFDHDGDLDLMANHAKLQIFNTMSIEQNLLLYRNDNSNGHNWLKIKLEGVTNNRDAYGSRIKIHFDGRTLIREIDGGSSHSSINSPIAHFGLGTNEMVDSIQVYWLGGEVQTIYNVPANQTIHLVEGEIAGLGIGQLNEFKLQLYPNPSKSVEELKMVVNSPKSQTVNVSICNVLGITLFEKDLFLNSGKQIISFGDFMELSTANNEVLIVKVTDADEQVHLSRVCIRGN